MGKLSNVVIRVNNPIIDEEKQLLNALAMPSTLIGKMRGYASQV